METGKAGKRYYFFVALIMMVSLVPVLYIARYDHPSADDYGYSMEIHFALENGAGFFQIIKTAVETSLEYMQTWQGLYSSAFVLSLQPAVFGEQLYALTPYIIILMLFLGTAAFFASVLKYVLGTRKRPALFIALIVACYMVQAMPAPCEGLFWFNGAVNYLFFWGIMMCEAALLIRYWFCQKHPIRTMLLAGVLSFSLSGGNHVTAFAGILFSLTACVFALCRKRKALTAIPAVTGIAGFILNITARGTYIRMTVDGKKVGILDTIIHGGFHAAACNSSYMTFSMLMLFVVLTPVLIHLIRSGNRKIHFSFVGYLGLLLFEFAIIAAMYCVPYYAMGAMGRGRVYDVRFVTYVLFAVITYGYTLVGLIDHWEARHEQFPALSKKASVSVLCVVLIAACYIAAFGGGINDRSTGVAALGSLYGGYAQQYDAEYYERLAILEDDTVQNAELPAFSAQPELLFFSDVEKDSGVWPNTTMAKYYGKRTVSLKAEAEE